MTIALDATYSVGRHLSGVGVYSREILAHLADLYPHEQFLWCYRPHRLRHAIGAARPANCQVRPLFEGWQWFRAALFHGLNQRMPAGRFRHSVSTFHDLFVLSGEYSTAEFRARFAGQARDAAARSELVICVSDFTARQVHELLGVEKPRLRVIPHGVRFPEVEAVACRDPYILHVGAIQKRKNLVRLVGAFERAAPPPWRLVLAGSDGYGSNEVHARIEASAARDRIEVTGWVDDKRLDVLYGRASIFAFPSLDEGFGIPVLEAMVKGVPVLASNRGALPEVCGNSAVVIDAEHEDGIAEALKRLVEDESLRKRLTAAGRERARLFSWEAAAQKTRAVYQELIPGLS